MRGEQIRRLVRKIRRGAKHEAQLAITAWIYFTRVRLPKRLTKYIVHSQHSLEDSTRYIPLVGIIIGGISGLVFLGSNELFDSKGLAILLSMVTSIALTGAFHEDGLADFFDGFGGGWWSKDRILEIMKDSRIGTFGSVAVILVLLIKYQSLLLLPSTSIVCVLIAAHAFSRFAAGSFIFTDHYVRQNDESYFKPMMKAPMRTTDFVIMAFVGMVPLLLVGSLLFLLFVPLLWIIRTFFGLWFIRKLGGYTGDCLGATQQIVELCFYLCIIIAFKHPITVS